jgi:AtzE family amidohydrolase
MSAATLAAAIRAGRQRAVAATEQALAGIAARNPALNAFTEVTAARALAEAAAVDADVAAGRDPGPLAGVPVAVKNLFDLAGMTTRAGAALRGAAPPATADAFVVARLRAAGAVVIGATNMDEFAFGFTTENSHDGPTRNPHDLSRVAGGSSGGSAAAVAAGLAPLAIGTDTNGSIRVPAALCGVFGLKPSFGRLSRRGAFPFVASFDHVGPFARDLADLALAYEAMQGVDAADPAQVATPFAPVALDQGIAGLRIASLGGHFAEGGHAEAFAAADLAARCLGVTATIAPPLAAEGRAAALLITLAEGASVHLEDLRARPEAFDPMTRDRFLSGALLSAQWLIQAQRVRALWRAAMARVFAEHDLLIAPCVPFVAPPIGTAMIEVAGRAVPARPQLGWFTQPISAIGLPAMSVPLADPASAGAPGGLPVAVQLIAPPWREDILFRAAGALVHAGFAASPMPKDFR